VRPWRGRSSLAEAKTHGRSMSVRMEQRD
jgi:hypothetical protein